MAQQILELFLQGSARQRVERAERLVEKQHLRIDRKRAGDRDALPHAARELRGALSRAAARLTSADALVACALARFSRSTSGKAASTASRTFSSAVNHGSSE